jgi:uncharacterized protein
MIILRVKVKPNSQRQAVQTLEAGSLVVDLKSPPTDGKANAALIKLLAREFHLARGQIQIKAGHSSRQKLVQIDALNDC